MSQYENFSSLPSHEERQFAIYEQRTAEASKKAMTLGAIVAGVFGFLVVVLFLASDPPEQNMVSEEEMLETGSGDDALGAEEGASSDPLADDGAASDPVGDSAAEGEEAAEEPAPGGE